MNHLSSSTPKINRTCQKIINLLSNYFIYFNSLVMCILVSDGNNGWCPKKFIVSPPSLYLYLNVSCPPPTPSSIFYHFQKACFNNYVFDVRHKYRSDGVGVWLSPLPTSYRRISVTESTRVVILSACATVRDGYVLCVCLEGWSFRCGSHSRTFPSLLSPPEPVWLWERVKCLSLIQLLEAQWPARESEKSYHPLHPPFKTRLMVREGRFRFSANIRAAGVAVHIG